MKRKKLLVTIAILLVVLAAEMVFLLYMPVEKEYGEFVLLHTPIGEMYFSEQWEKYTVVEETTTAEGYTATISAETNSGTVHIYTLHIGHGFQSGILVGYVDGCEIWVGVPNVAMDASWREKDVNVVYSMQEEAEGIVNQITKLEGFHLVVPNGNIPEEIEGDFVLLNTPAGEICFTKQWEAYLNVDEQTTEDVYTADIFAKTKSGSVKLCTVYIGTDADGGVLIGYVNDVATMIDLPTIDTDGSWTQSDIDIVYLIQEDLECIIDQIEAVNSFSMERPTDDSSAVIPGQYVLLSTPVGDLYFCEQWTDYLLTEEIAMDVGYMASVSVKTTSGTARLVELYIGTEINAGMQIGYIHGDAIYMNILDAELDEEWTTENVDIAYTVQEELECIANQIAEMDGFSYES